MFSSRHRRLCTSSGRTSEFCDITRKAASSLDRLVYVGLGVHLEAGKIRIRFASKFWISAFPDASSPRLLPWTVRDWIIDRMGRGGVWRPSSDPFQSAGLLGAALLSGKEDGLIFSRRPPSPLHSSTLAHPSRSPCLRRAGSLRRALAPALKPQVYGSLGWDRRHLKTPMVRALRIGAVSG